MTISEYGTEKDIPADKIYREKFDWFDLNNKCLDMIENFKDSKHYLQMSGDIKVHSCNKLENVLTQQSLQTPCTEQEYGKINAEMNPEKEPLNIEYELDSAMSSGYESENSERDKEQLSDEPENEIVRECEDNYREVIKNLEEN